MASAAVMVSQSPASPAIQCHSLSCLGIDLAPALQLGCVLLGYAFLDLLQQDLFSARLIIFSSLPLPGCIDLLPFLQWYDPCLNANKQWTMDDYHSN
jgi:hypothetical protein